MQKAPRVQANNKQHKQSNKKTGNGSNSATTNNSKKRKEPFSGHNNTDYDKKRPYKQQQPYDWNNHYRQTALNNSVAVRRNDTNLLSMLIAPMPSNDNNLHDTNQLVLSQVVMSTQTPPAVAVIPPPTSVFQNNLPFEMPPELLFDHSAEAWAKTCYRTLRRCLNDNDNGKTCFAAVGPDGSGKAMLVDAILAQCVQNNVMSNRTRVRVFNFDPSNYETLSLNVICTQLHVLLVELIQYRKVNDIIPSSSSNVPASLDKKFHKLFERKQRGRRHNDTLSMTRSTSPQYAGVLFLRDIDAIYECYATIFTKVEMLELHESLCRLVRQDDWRVPVFVTCSSVNSWYVRDLLKNHLQPMASCWLRSIPVPTFSQRIEWLAKLLDNRENALDKWIKKTQQRLLAFGTHLTVDTLDYIAYNAGPKLLQKHGKDAELYGSTRPTSMSQWICNLAWLFVSFLSYVLDHGGDEEMFTHNRGGEQLGSDDMAFSYHPLFSCHALDRLLTRGGNDVYDREKWWTCIFAHINLSTVMTQFSGGVWDTAIRRRTQSTRRTIRIPLPKDDEDGGQQQYAQKSIIVYDIATDMLSTVLDSIAIVDVLIGGELWRDSAVVEEYAATLIDTSLGAYKSPVLKTAPVLKWTERMTMINCNGGGKRRDLDQQWW